MGQGRKQDCLCTGGLFLSTVTLQRDNRVFDPPAFKRNERSKSHVLATFLQVVNSLRYFQAAIRFETIQPQKVKSAERQPGGD